MKNLIVYYSYEGNTEEIVKALSQDIEADVLKLVPEKEKKTPSLYRFVWGGMQVYMTKKPKLKSYHVDMSKYSNIIIACPCWFGTFAPPINTFISENLMTNKNIYLLVCNGGNMRNTWENFEKALSGSNIVSKLDLVYPIKNGIQDAKDKATEWIKSVIQ